MNKALEIAKQENDNEPFIIGGGQIYAMALKQNLIDKIYLTKVHHVFEGDTFFPELTKEWKQINNISQKADPRHAYDYSFLTFEKIN